MPTCYFLVQTAPGAAGRVAAHARALPPVDWADAVTGSYDVLARAVGDRDELAEVSVALRRRCEVERVLICTPGALAPVRSEEARVPAPR
ncbi:MAG: hypothetical protein ACJ735_10195 [Actinomycetes bacterium]